MSYAGIRTTLILPVLRREGNKNPPFGGFLILVAGPGGAPGLEDYEPSVRLYTTPRSF